MNKTIILIIACLMAWVNSISAEDKIYVTDFSITAEETKDVSVLMDNDIPYVAFQFDLYLPEGITLAGYEVSGSRVPESTEISMAKMDDGSYRFIAAAMSMEEITGNSGGIVTLKLKASSEITTGIKTGYLKRVKLSKADATGFTTAEIPFAIKVLAPITVTAKSYTRKYGEANPAFEYDVTGDMEGTPIVSCEATATSPVGTYSIVVAKGSVTNYNGSYVNGTLTIEKAPLTVTAKSYTIKQGEALPTFEVEYDGFKNDESVDVLAKKATVTCSATSASAPNTYDIVVSGAEAGNYEISCVKGTLTIVEADPVTVTAKSYTRKYGEANPAFEYTSEGKALDGTPEITCEATAASPVGTYPIVVSKGSVTNYNDSYVNGTLTIEKAPLTITGQNYVVKQGDALPTFEVVYEGFKNSETSDVLTKQPTITCSATSSSVIGTYEILVSGAEAENYNISYVTGALSVIDADAVVITANSYTRKYGEANPAFEYTSEGKALDGTPEITCEATAASPVGTYPIVVSKGCVTNYNDSYVNGVLTITKASLKITAKSYTIKQGEALPAFEATYSGFKNKETTDVLTTKPTITCSATSASAPNTYEIVVTGAEADNYDISYVAGTLTITDADAVVVTAKSYTRKYGEANPEFEYTSAGADLEGTPSVSCEATAASPVGTYPIVVSKGGVTNFNDSYVNGTLTITKAPLSITAQSYVIKQGEALPTFEVTYEGFKNNENANVLTKQPIITCAASSSSELGTYEIVVSGAEAGNYDISYVAGTLSVVDADAVVVTAKSYSREYGEENPEFEYTAVGVDLEGTPEITCEATETSSVGTYSIVVSKGSVANYNDTYINGTLTITKAPLSITAQSYVIKQGDTMPAFGVSIDGFKNKDTKDVFKKQMTITCAATSSEEVGTFDIVVSEAEAENYEITFVNGTLTIEAVETPVDNTFEEEGASYEKQDDGTVTFTEQENSTGENYEVPETVTHDGVEYQVTSIAEGAFKDNVNLKELSIPESIVSIGDDALAGCTNLEKINLYSDKPISIDQADASSVFSGVDTENCILYVPAGTAEAYRQAEGWKVFKNIVEMEDPDDINEINADDDTYQIYSLDGKQVEALQKGVNIIKYKKGSTQKVYVK